MQNIDRDDKQIINDYLEGDEESLRILIDKYLRPVYNFTYHICNNTEDAEDITAEVFIKIWKNLKKYKPEQNFKVWLFAIVKNTTLDWLRKRKSLVFSDFETQDGENFIENMTPDSAPLQDELAVLKEDKIILSEKISRLSPIYQSILVLRYTEELSFKEIGEVLQKSINTVKSQHRRALMELRKLFNN